MQKAFRIPLNKKISVHLTVLFEAYKELGLLLVLIVVAILVYSSLVYFAERDSSSNLGEGAGGVGIKKQGTFSHRSELH